MLTPTTEHHFLTAEQRSGYTFNWQTIGEYVRTVRDAHDLILDTMSSQIVTDAKRYPVNSWQRSFFRGQYQIIQDERKARRAGDLPYWMRPRVEGEVPLEQRVALVHDRVSILDFIERECGIDVDRNRCKCPIHQGENRMEFSIWHNRGKCWSCGFSGDVFNLAQSYWGSDKFMDVLTRLEAW